MIQNNAPATLLFNQINGRFYIPQTGTTRIQLNEPIILRGLFDKIVIVDITRTNLDGLDFICVKKGQFLFIGGSREKFDPAASAILN